MAIKKKKVRSLEGIIVKEVSLCREGMNPEAKIEIFKMKENKKIEKAKTFQELLDSDQNVKRKAMQDFEMLSRILRDSVEGIVWNYENDQIDSMEKETRLRQSFDQFNSVVKTLTADLSKSNGGFKMNPIEKAIEEIKKMDKGEDVLKTLQPVFDSIESVQKDVEGLKKSNEELKKENEELKKNTDEGDDDPIAKAKKEGASKTIIELLEKQQAEAKIEKEKREESDKKLEKLADENLKKSFEEKVTKKMEGIEKADVLADVLVKLHKLDPEVCEHVEKLFEKASNAIKEGDLFKEKGKGGTNNNGGSNEVVGKVKILATELRKANPSLSESEAEAKVWENNPDLYKEYTASRN